MRAALCREVGDPTAVRVEEVPDPEPGPGEVLVAVGAAAANFPDLLMVQGRYQFRPDPPFAPGLEIAGTVVAGDGFEPGDRVMAFVAHGGWAERVPVPGGNAFAIPATMPYRVAAVLPVAYGTAIHALVDRARLEAGETLVVLGGAGGVGLAAVQVGRALGARVVAVVGSAEKERAALGSGAEAVIRSDRDDLRTALRTVAPDGADVVFDPVGGPATETAFRSLAWEGRLLVIGFAAGDIPAIPANLALLKGASLVGVFWGRFAEADPVANRDHFSTLVRWWEEGVIAPVVSGEYPLEGAATVLQRLGDRSVVGKLVLVP